MTIPEGIVRGFTAAISQAIEVAAQAVGEDTLWEDGLPERFVDLQPAERAFDAIWVAVAGEASGMAIPGAWIGKQMVTANVPRAIFREVARRCRRRGYSYAVEQPVAELVDETCRYMETRRLPMQTLWHLPRVLVESDRLVQRLNLGHRIRAQMMDSELRARLGLSDAGRFSDLWYTGQICLVHDYEAEIDFNSNESVRGDSDWAPPLRDCNAFVRAVSLATAASGAVDVQATCVAGFSPFPLGQRWSEGGSRPGFRMAIIKEDNLDEIVRLYQALRGEIHPSIGLALDRLVMALTRRSDEDAILDVAIGLEAILLYDVEPSELSFRFAMAYASFFRGSERNREFRVARAFYDVRSSIAHGSDPKARALAVLGTPGTKHQAAEVGVSMLRETVLEYSNDFALPAFARRAEGDLPYWTKRVLDLGG